MQDKETPAQVDFSRFWVQYRKPDGELITARIFDDNAFAAVFGQPAATAYGIYADKIAKKPKDEQAIEEAANTVQQATGVHPDVIRKAKEEARIENL